MAAFSAPLQGFYHINHRSTHGFALGFESAALLA
jgi:hypothetical protein